jgi:hypothetical protein
MMVHSWMVFVYHIDRCTLFGMLVDAHVGILVDAHVGIWWIHFMDDIFWYIVDVHGCCAWWAHFGT